MVGFAICALSGGGEGSGGSIGGRSGSGGSIGGRSGSGTSTGVGFGPGGSIGLGSGPGGSMMGGSIAGDDGPVAPLLARSRMSIRPKLQGPFHVDTGTGGKVSRPVPNGSQLAVTFPPRGK